MNLFEAINAIVENANCPMHIASKAARAYDATEYIETLPERTRKAAMAKIMKEIEEYNTADETGNSPADYNAAFLG